MDSEIRHNHLIRGLVVIIVVIAGCLWSSGKSLAQEVPTGVITHIVSWGETISSIAAKYGVTIDEIVTHNHLVAPDRIYAGQQLIIPTDSAETSNGSNTQSTHIVGPGENLYRISLLYGISIQALVTANGLTDQDQVFAGQRLIIPRSGVTLPDSSVSSVDTSVAVYHDVKPGETLSGISLKYGVAVSDLQITNNILNPSHIFVGQRLIIPGAVNSVGPGYTPQQAITTHIVEPGETLFVIANRYGISMWVVAQVNNISNPSFIYSGQRLSIPLNSALTADTGANVPFAKSIVVDISEQRTHVYEDGIPIQTFVVSTGVPGQDTMRGTFQIQNKIPVAYATTWDLEMPYWLGFYWAGSLQNGFHALPILPNGVRLWEGLLGTPASYGCVILSEEAAQWLYEWAEVGTPVTVQS